MELLQLLIFGGAAIVNYFNTQKALWVTLFGLLLPLVEGMIK